MNEHVSQKIVLNVVSYSPDEEISLVDKDELTDFVCEILNNEFGKDELVFSPGRE